MTIDYGHANLTNACALVDAMVTSGVRHAVICPGSRSTPLALALATHDGTTTSVLIDERSAAFFALGMARQLAAPVALLSTSGTAPANFLPAVAEASLSRVPLIVLTADRPPELRGWGAPQTIDQHDLFGSHTKWSVDLPPPDGDHALVRHARAMAVRAVQTASSAPAGVVHLNLPFREPLLPEEVGDVLHGGQFAPHEGLTLAAAGHDAIVCQLGSAAVSRLAEIAASEERGIIVCGPYEGSHLGCVATRLSAATGYPVLADALSGVRFGPWQRGGTIDAYDTFLRDAEVAEALAPVVVIRVGAIPTSKLLQQFLARYPGRHHVLIDSGSPRDPSHLASVYLNADPVVAFAQLAESLATTAQRQSTAWCERWQSVDRLTAVAIAESIRNDEEMAEGRAVAEVVAALPTGATLMVGNSMPVRDLDTYVRGDDRSLQCVANRGANGIDGVISSALGTAAVAGGPVALVVGDLSFYHDMNGLLAARKLGLSATIVVLNNDGGGIFSFLPQATQLDEGTFERLFGTPVGLDVQRVAELYRATYAAPRTWPAFRASIAAALSRDGLSIIEVTTDRRCNHAKHRLIADDVVEKVRTSWVGMA